MMIVGALNAVLVMRLLRPVGLVVATAGGLFYALYYLAALVGRKTLLEGLANLCLLVSLLILGGCTRSWNQPPAWPLRRECRSAVAAGIKIWGVVAIVAIVAYVWRPPGGPRCW